uniref:XPGN domain-containing protein n=1 Tax=Mesocestoides corti TaxID=53468 RepID=A0A5K3FP83_MESCO
MGVYGLWTLLSPVQEHIPLRSLGGKKIAVDLSGWTCCDMFVNQRARTSCKLYIRNLIFRLIALLREAIIPVAVTDGTAPGLKASVLRDRRQASRFTNTQETAKPVNLKRPQFYRISTQCFRLLKALGVPCVASPGEAEAMCAFLNSEGLVDGCVTNDGDAFLYGASLVYRHFSLNSRDASVEAYCAKRVHSELGLCRQSLVFLGLILGCDYWPSGVPKVGPTAVGKLLSQVDVVEAFERLTVEHKEETGHKASVWMSPTWKKIKACLADCPVSEVLNEFLTPWHKRGWQMPTAESLTWSQPNIRCAVELCIEFLDWQPRYALAQFVPLLAIWIVRMRTASTWVERPRDPMQPLRIIRKRSVNYLPCFEVEWSRLDNDMWSKGIATSSSLEKSLVSLNDFFTESGYRISLPVAEFRVAFPHLAIMFESLSLKSLSAKMNAGTVKDKRVNTKLKCKPADEAKSGPIDAFVKQAPKKSTIRNLSPWDSFTESPPHLSRPPVDAVFTPSPPADKRLSQSFGQCDFISVRLTSEFERRLTLESSLLASTPTQSPSIAEFVQFKTPPRLIDRLK